MGSLLEGEQDETNRHCVHIRPEEMRDAVMPGHRCVLAVEEGLETANVDLLISLMPINDPMGQPDNTAVCIPWRKCSENVCGQAAKEQGMTFAGEYPESRDEFMDSWDSLNAARIQANDDFEADEEASRKAAEDKEKGKKKATPRKKRGAPGTGEEADPEPAQETGEGSSKPKRKGKSKVAIGKKPLELSLDEAWKPLID